MNHSDHGSMSHDHSQGYGTEKDGDRHDDHRGGGKAEAVSFDTEQKGSKDGDVLRAGEIFRADLQALNHSGVSGYVELARQGDHLIRNPADWIGEAGFPVLSRSW